MSRHIPLKLDAMLYVADATPCECEYTLVFGWMRLVSHFIAWRQRPFSSDLDLRPYLVVAWPTRNNCVRWSAEVGERHSPDRTLSSFYTALICIAPTPPKSNFCPPLSLALLASHPSVHYEMIIRRCQTEN